MTQPHCDKLMNMLSCIPDHNNCGQQKNAKMWRCLDKAVLAPRGLGANQKTLDTNNNKKNNKARAVLGDDKDEGGADAYKPSRAPLGVHAPSPACS